MSNSLDAYLILSALLFSIGTFGFLARRNAISMLMSIELMLNAVNLAIVAFATRVPVALVLGWLFLRRNSIWASIGLHATFNGILLLLGELALRSGAV